jgi:hypothetical protein
MEVGVVHTREVGDLGVFPNDDAPRRADGHALVDENMMADHQLRSPLHGDLRKELAGTDLESIAYHQAPVIVHKRKSAYHQRTSPDRGSLGKQE